MIIKQKQKLLILTDWFYPGFKAGGPIQSLTNLVVTLENQYEIYVITSAFDLHSTSPYNSIKQNEWNTIKLPGSTMLLNIWYAEINFSLKELKKTILQIKPGIVYLNGIFSYKFFILPLIALKGLSHFPKVVICPRGMLQEGALSGKSLKKKFFITTLKFSGLLKKTFWHATNSQEENDIQKIFGKTQQIYIASNIPKKPLPTIQFPSKKDNKLRLVYLSLIAEKKNLSFALELIKSFHNVTLDIFGPIKDLNYWNECEKLISQLPEQIKYKGEIIPGKVQETFMKYDAFILLTKGENFGHALYESLSAARPIITSFFTPWVNLEKKKAGWNIDITNKNEGLLLLNNLCNMPVDNFNEYCEGAHKMSLEYYNSLNSIDEYTTLFSRVEI